MTTLAFIDTETTGLDPERHEIWEVALIRRDSNGAETEYVWQLPVDLSVADPIALNIGRFHDRRWPEPTGLENRRQAQAGDWGESPLARCRLTHGHLIDWADRFAELTRDAHLVGAVVSFDADRLWRLLRRLGQCPMWHYHLVDVEALAAGYLAGRHRGLSLEAPLDDRHATATPPWSSDELSRAVGVDPDQFDRHTALGDARWAKAIYDAVTGAVVDA